ncbi:excisionase family DNA-binding protein [Candidatus Uhrbacteria bacterium]|nr:excisionase family DNA-binding protein [Candidatus Uhrbacteria bacterium]
MSERRTYSTTEVARLLGVSRIAVFKKVKQGKIRAERVGRKYVIHAEDLPAVLGVVLTNREKRRLDDAVDRTVKEYGETLRLLGRE